MNHFLITDHNRDGEHEYYDLVLVSTTMSEAEMHSDHNDWQKAFLDWQFSDTHGDEDGNIWSNNRIVSIYEVKNVPEEDAPILERYLGTFDLDKIIKEYYEAQSMSHAEKESIIWASGQYLTLHLPQDYDTWEEEKLYNHLVEFVWEPFECFSGEQVWKLIKELARTKEEA